MTNVEEIILKAFEDAGKPLRPGDVAKITGIDSKEVSKAIKILSMVKSSNLFRSFQLDNACDVSTVGRNVA